MPVLAGKPGALRNGAPFKDWVLPAGLERIRRKLAGSAGSQRQTVGILTTALSGQAGGDLQATEGAQHALHEGVHSADVVINMAVKRQFEPQRIVGDLLDAEISEKQERSIRSQIPIAKLPLAKDVDEFQFDDRPINETPPETPDNSSLPPPTG